MGNGTILIDSIVLCLYTKSYSYCFSKEKKWNLLVQWCALQASCQFAYRQEPWRNLQCRSSSLHVNLRWMGTSRLCIRLPKNGGMNDKACRESPFRLLSNSSCGHFFFLTSTIYERNRWSWPMKTLDRVGVLFHSKYASPLAGKLRPFHFVLVFRSKLDPTSSLVSHNVSPYMVQCHTGRFFDHDEKKTSIKSGFFFCRLTFIMRILGRDKLISKKTKGKKYNNKEHAFE